LVSLGRMDRDGAAGPPYEVGRMGAHHQSCPVRHARSPYDLRKAFLVKFRGCVGAVRPGPDVQKCDNTAVCLRRSTRLVKFSPGPSGGAPAGALNGGAEPRPDSGRARETNPARRRLNLDIGIGETS